MRHALAVLVLAATAASGAVSIEAADLRMSCENYWNTDTSPTATAGGRVFINTGGGPALWHDVAYDDSSWSIANDLSIELLAGSSPSNLAHIALDPDSLYVPWPGHTKADYTSIWLRDTGTGANPPVEVPNAGNYNMSWFSNSDPFPPGSMDGTFMDWSTFDQPYVIPNTDGMTGAYFEIRIWTGNSATYPTYAAARAGNQFVADTGIIYRGLQSDPLMPPGNLGDVMPAMILQRYFPGDANFDGKVDINDLSLVLTSYDKTGMAWNQGDFNGDGKVDINDLSIVLTNYDKSAAAAGMGAAAVPEPGTLALLAVALVGAMVHVRRRRG